MTSRCLDSLRHSITSSARARSVGGTAMPSALRGLQVNDQLKLGRRLHRQVSLGLLSLQDAVDVTDAARRCRA